METRLRKEGTYGTLGTGRGETINRHTGGTQEGNEPKFEAQVEHSQTNEAVRVSTSVSVFKYLQIFTL